MTKKTSEVGKKLIKQFEGFRAAAYVCPAGVVTIGYGTTEIFGKPVKLGSTITSDEADRFLEEDLKKFEDAINKNVNITITQNQFDALVSFVYNVGIGNFITSTLLKKINEGKIQDAANEFLRWNKANKKVLAGLTRRRQAERDLFLKE